MGTEVCKLELAKALAKHLGLEKEEITDTTKIPLDFDLIGFFYLFQVRNPDSCGVFSSDDFETVGDITNSVFIL